MTLTNELVYRCLTAVKLHVIGKQGLYNCHADVKCTLIRILLRQRNVT